MLKMGLKIDNDFSQTNAEKKDERNQPYKRATYSRDRGEGKLKGKQRGDDEKLVTFAKHNEFVVFKNCINA